MSSGEVPTMTVNQGFRYIYVNQILSIIYVQRYVFKAG